MMNYRREIDGLRALAVLPVILFHAGFATFSGGFVGVDVFFVISGYLITSIILAEKESGTFSLIKFYERRARRILPALFFVMATCIPFAWLWLLPNDMKDFSQSLVAVSVFASNILFWRESGYFDTAAELKPLLHTWSLAVEEQYYVLFPLFIMLTWRLGKRWIVGILVVVAVISLALAQWGAYNNYAFATFFLLPTRGWELAIGAFIALWSAQRQHIQITRAVRQAASGAGLLLILYAVFAFSNSTPFPSLYALVPTIGTALIILFATPNTIVGTVLGTKAFVGVGLISYSAYLWHQPLFAFARHRTLIEPHFLILLLLSVAAIVLAYFSWRFIECPFRDKSLLTGTTIFLSSALMSFSFVGFGLVGHTLNNFHLSEPQRLRLQDLEFRVHVNYGLDERCEYTFTLSEVCRTDAQPEVLLWGDSYAKHLMQGLLASKPGVKVIQTTVSQCGPMLDVAPLYAMFGAKECIETNDQVLSFLTNSKSIKYVVLGSHFGQYIENDAKILLRDGSIVSAAHRANQYMLDTLRHITALGVTPVVFAPTPQNGNNIGQCLLKAKFFNLPSELCDFDLSEANKKQEKVIDFLKRVSESYKVIWLSDEICRSGRCKAAIGDTLIYRDTDHLSDEGSALIGRRMDFYGRITGKSSNEFVRCC
jgi:peptidoglycan/LPS O-acetylase OafA/YrhL